jgi:hypothetical protein
MQRMEENFVPWRFLTICPAYMTPRSAVSAMREIVCNQNDGDGAFLQARPSSQD